MDKKLKLYKILGAEQFQNVVFIVEKLKYKVIDKFFPNINIWYEKKCDKKFLKIIKNNNIENKKGLLNMYQKSKLAFRKELVYKQNRNYHYDINHPTEFVKYLNINKRIHKKGIKKNIAVSTVICIFSLIIGNPFPVITNILLLSQLVMFIINFECINLQNYNLLRFENERTQNLLRKVEEKKLNSNLKKLDKCIEVVSETVNSKLEIPTVDDVVNRITTKEQAKQLLEYVKEQYLYLEQKETKDNNRKKVLK